MNISKNQSVKNRAHRITRNRQGGLTLVGFILVLVLVIAGILLGMKLYPMYQEYYAVVTAMNEIAEEPGIAGLSPAEIRKKLFFRMSVNYVQSVDKEHVQFSRKNGYRMRVEYEVRKPVVGNLDVVGRFEKTVTLGASPG